MKLSSRIASISAIAGLLSLGLAAPSHATEQITFSVDAPDVQGSFVDGAILEDFNDGCVSPLAFGTLTGSCGSSGGPTFYAGASSTAGTPFTGGTGTQYAIVSSGQSLTISLDAPANYLGFHWEAGNEYDRVMLYSDDTLLANFSFSSLMDALDATGLTTIGGGAYTSADYYGNPVNGAQGHEPYAYVHIFASSGVQFDRVVIAEDAGSPGEFEFDNMAIASNADESFTNVVELDVVDLSGPASTELSDTGFDGTLVLVAGLALASIGFIARRRHS